MSQQKGEKAVLPNKKISDFQIRESEYSVIDISYAELPEKPTGRIKMYITAAALVGICAVCARLSIR
ncbi:MAG: hypothetical protein HFH85_19655, partial [Lachnospiraceae bacterium]|nr:hypothetical protein [Lachnospiraceae bacterium]